MWVVCGVCVCVCVFRCRVGGVCFVCVGGCVCDVCAC